MDTNIRGKFSIYYLTNQVKILQSAEFSKLVFRLYFIVSFVDQQLDITIVN